MNILETEWWTICVPSEWWADQEDESILIGDRDEVGCIVISTLQKEQGSFEASEVQQIAIDESEQECNWSKISCGDFDGVGSAFTEEDQAVREWYVARGASLLYITYCCDAENAGLDDAPVDEILGTLLTASASP